MSVAPVAIALDIFRRPMCNVAQQFIFGAALSSAVASEGVVDMSSLRHYDILH
jgi:hypothetical protein